MCARVRACVCTFRESRLARIPFDYHPKYMYAYRVYIDSTIEEYGLVHIPVQHCIATLTCVIFIDQPFGDDKLGCITAHKLISAPIYSWPLVRNIFSFGQMWS